MHEIFPMLAAGYLLTSTTYVGVFWATHEPSTTRRGALADVAAAACGAAFWPIAAAMMVTTMIVASVRWLLIRASGNVQ